MPRKFDQDVKDRVVRLVEDRILAEKYVDAHGPSMDLSLPAVQETSQNLCLKTWPQRTRGYAVKIKSYATLMSY